MKQIKFGFEDLEVRQKAMEFVNEVIRLIGILDTDRKHYRLIEQLEGCSTSIALNIAEGKIHEEGVRSVPLYSTWLLIRDNYLVDYFL